MILLTIIISLSTLVFLSFTIIGIINLHYKIVYPNAVLLVLCVIFLVLIKSSLLEKELLNSNCGTNFSHAEVLFANSAVKNIYESKGSCYPKLEEEEFQ